VFARDWFSGRHLQMEIRGTQALVTGGGSGIGRAIVVALARAGARRVHIVDVDREGAGISAELARAEGAEAFVHFVDVADTGALTALFDALSDHPLDIVCNNAGIMSGQSAFPDTDISRIAKVIAVNYAAVVMGTKLASLNMRAHGLRGAIVNTASRTAITPGRGDPVYAGSKAAVLQFTRSCAGLNESHGIRVNAVCPAITQTAIIAKTGGDKPADWMISRLKGVKVLPPEAIAAAVLELVTDDSRAADFVIVDNEVDARVTAL
jgi:NAD(P)-dependent dehydrogenase (short-subunit alcohol dehydrogenase family)